MLLQLLIACLRVFYNRNGAKNILFGSWKGIFTNHKTFGHIKELLDKGGY